MEPIDVTESHRLYIQREYSPGDNLELFYMQDTVNGIEYAVMERSDFEALLSETITAGAHPDVALLFEMTTPKPNKRTAAKPKARKAKSVKASLKPTTRANRKLSARLTQAKKKAA